MDDSQGINKYDSILDIVFDPDSYEMDEKEMLNNIWKIHFLDFTTKGNGGAYATKARSGRELWIGLCFPSVVVHVQVSRLTTTHFSANRKITAR